MLHLEWLHMLKCSEIQQLCSNRNLPIAGQKKALIKLLKEQSIESTNNCINHAWTLKQLQIELKARGISSRGLKKSDIRQLLNTNVSCEENKLLSLISSPNWMQIQSNRSENIESADEEHESRSELLNYGKMNGKEEEGNQNENEVEIQQMPTSFTNLQNQLQFFLTHVRDHTEVMINEAKYNIDYTLNSENNLSTTVKNREYLTSDEWNLMVDLLRKCRDNIHELREHIQDCTGLEFDEYKNCVADDCQDIQYINNDSICINYSASAAEDSEDESKSESEIESECENTSNFENWKKKVFVVYDGDTHKIIKQDPSLVVALFDKNNDAEQCATAGKYEMQELCVDEWFESKSDK